ncbi:MAG: cyclophilin [Beggiatoa sp. IS2]|nr:MAG: cyclophilin [Beggiatoa sp. IS2]
MQVKIQTNYGTITLQLNSEKAPKTVKNFLDYVNSGYYNGTLFHRVIDGFMIQGGGLEPGMRAKPASEPIENEATNSLSNKIGTVAMARTSEPHSASSQFFINVGDNTFLDHTGRTQKGWGYCVFGEVVDGMDVVNTIKGVATTQRSGSQDVPTKDVLIETAEVLSN